MTDSKSQQQVATGEGNAIADRGAIAISNVVRTTADRLPRFQSNVQPHRNQLIGRSELLQTIIEGLGTPQRDLLVLHGPPGVGKSELAREVARRRAGNYPGGTFEIDCSSGAPEVELARIGQNILGLEFSLDLKVRDQGEQTLYTLAATPSLLIYDNVTRAESIRPWLPPADSKCHILITTFIDDWDPGWWSIPVEPLSREDSVRLITELAGPEAARQRGDVEVELAGGLPVQLCAAAAALAKAYRRSSLRSLPDMTREAEASFSKPYTLLGAEAQLFLRGIAFLRADRLPREEVVHQFQKAFGWDEAKIDSLIGSCLDLHMLEGGVDLRLHQLIAQFILSTPLHSESETLLRQLRSVQSNRLAAIARDLGSNPAKADLAAALLLFPLTPQKWVAQGVDISIESTRTIGYALIEIGHFEEARGWYERAVAAIEQDDVHGHIDHASLGRSLHQAGVCLSSMGQFAEARGWYERAVVAKEQGDVHGRIDHASLGRSVHQVGLCLSSVGEFAEARGWYERAVAAAEQGDVHGRIDHDNLGRSLHQVGVCLSSVGQFAEARGWYERAVAAIEQGDVHGRIDHEGLGSSLHCVGFCLSSVGEFAEARGWFERAVAASEQGDVHGRVDHASLGSSLHCVAFCLSSMGQFAEARGWYERAVAAAEQGDVHGRIDHDSLGSSLHQVGLCLSSMGQFVEARGWYERAVAAAEQGDVHGRVDHESLGLSLHQVGVCLSSVGQFAEARGWYERAVAAAEQGNVHGRSDHDSLGRSLHQMGVCLSSVGQFAEARGWYERAVVAKEQGDVLGRIDHEGLGRSLHQVGLCLSSVEQFDEARDWYERAVAAKEQGDVHGRVDHESLKNSRLALSNCLRHL